MSLHLVDYKGAGKIAKPRLPLVVVNTTAGTGSEVTRFAIITDPATNVKMLIADPHLVPDVAIDDPLLTLTCSPFVTASTGLDALTHAIESYVSVRATALSEVLVLSAIRKIARSLRAAFARGEDLAARTLMHVASLEAGMAFSNSSVALVHGMARPVGASFRAAHGISNAVLLPHVTAWSLPGAPGRFADIARALGVDTAALRGSQAAKRAVAEVQALCRDPHIPGLTGLGIGPAKLMALAPTMAKDALDSGSPDNNPRVPSQEEIVELYRSALEPDFRYWTPGTTTSSCAAAQPFVITGWRTQEGGRVQTHPLGAGRGLRYAPTTRRLKCCHPRRKDGTAHRYWSIT